MAATVAIQLLPHHSPYSHIRQCQTLRTYHVEIEGKEAEQQQDEHDSLFDVEEVLSRVSTPYGHIRTVQQKSKQKDGGKRRVRVHDRRLNGSHVKEEKSAREEKESDPVATDTIARRICGRHQPSVLSLYYSPVKSPGAVKVLEVKLPEPKLGNRNSPTAGSAVSTKLLVRAHTSRVCRMIRKQCRKFDCVSSAQLERVVRALALPQVVMAIEQTAQLGKVDKTRRKGMGTDGALGDGRSLSRSGSQSCLKREDRGRARALAEKKMNEMQARELKRKEESKWEEDETHDDEEKLEKEQEQEQQQQQQQIEHEGEDKENVQTPTFQGIRKSNLCSASENGKRDRKSMKDLAKRLEDHFGAVIPRQLNFKNYGRPRVTGSDTVVDEASEQKTQDRAEKRALRQRMPQQPERDIPREPRNGGGRGRRRRNRRRRVGEERL